MFTWEQAGAGHQDSAVPPRLPFFPATPPPSLSHPFPIAAGRVGPVEGAVTRHYCPQEVAVLSAGKAEGAPARGRGRSLLGCVSGRRHTLLR